MNTFRIHILTICPVALAASAYTCIEPPVESAPSNPVSQPMAPATIPPESDLRGHPQPTADCLVTQPSGRTREDEQSFAEHHGKDALIAAVSPNGVDTEPLDFSALYGYGDTGFQASGLLLPTEDCWKEEASPMAAAHICHVGAAPPACPKSERRRTP